MGMGWTMTRTICRTHPWINFTFDMRKPGPSFWLKLGEAQSKAQHVSGVPLLPDVQISFFRLYMAKGVLATTAIEGNTLSEEQVRLQLDGKLKLPPSKEYLQLEVQNVIDACNSIGRKTLAGESTRLTPDKLRRYNDQVLKDLSVDDDVCPGEFRNHEVGVGRYKGAPWHDVETLTERLCAWINDDFHAPEGYEIAFGVIRAILAHLYIAWIHPFGDGNGRTARLVEFEILLSVGVPDVAAHLLSNHYNQTRSEYYRHLGLSSRTNDGDPFSFVIYALQGLVDGLVEQIQTIKNQQLTVHWINYIHEGFKDRDTAAFTRRRQLAIDLTNRGAPVPIQGIRHVSPRIAEAYANKTDKTVKRDLNALEKLALLRREKQGYQLNIETILAFLPQVRPKE